MFNNAWSCTSTSAFNTGCLVTATALPFSRPAILNLLRNSGHFCLQCKVGGVSDTGSHLLDLYLGLLALGWRREGPDHAPIVDRLPTSKPKDEIGVESLC
jgi:hypothetical protein